MGKGMMVVKYCGIPLFVGYVMLKLTDYRVASNPPIRRTDISEEEMKKIKVMNENRMRQLKGIRSDTVGVW
eukprot:CAMPEP_0119135904 /NCGR_PEP_ID=MMETSP1310-20130426/20305_1 /TAXON_ID=464262 /ORGANISM="Genus nov. species nov., Strain RCC2339" /LENGTH=70 /DNA_ID=CAMNT_0007126849 /DNA_START=29 /DNA_END=238 /DNA_ORIENTATION=+